MTKTQFLPIFLGRRYARSQYFLVQNFQGIHVFGFEFYRPYAHPRIQIYEEPTWGLDARSSLKKLLSVAYRVSQKEGKGRGAKIIRTRKPSALSPYVIFIQFKALYLNRLIFVCCLWQYKQNRCFKLSHFNEKQR